MGRSDNGSESERRKSKKNAMDRDDRQARQTLAVPQQPEAALKPKNKKLVAQLGSNGKIQQYRYAKEQESQEKRLYARNGKEEYKAYACKRHAKEEYRGYSSNERAGRRSSPPPKLQMMLKNHNPVLKKKAVASKDDDSRTSSEEDEDESSSEADEDDKSTSEFFKKMSRMEVTSSKFMKTKMMKW